METDLVIFNHSQVMSTTPELALLSLNFHITPTGRTDRRGKGSLAKGSYSRAHGQRCFMGLSPGNLRSLLPLARRGILESGEPAHVSWLRTIEIQSDFLSGVEQSLLFIESFVAK
ncbi:hypothetical protein TNCV_2410441 [Trichonephila clavipes]|nr:hypothetical protein TNCV_2410441 [Trichonephila clavipes]